MITVELTEEQAAAIANSLNASKKTDNKKTNKKCEGNTCRTCGPEKYSNYLKEDPPNAFFSLTKVTEYVPAHENLLLTVLADLRALRVATETESRRKVAMRAEAIIDGIENTLAEI